MHEQVELCNKTLLNIFHNFIPNKIILCDDKDPWMNYEIKKLIKNRKELFLCQIKSDNLDYASLNSITQDISNTDDSVKLKNPLCVLHSSLMTLKQPQKPTGKY